MLFLFFIKISALYASVYYQDDPYFETVNFLYSTVEKNQPKSIEEFLGLLPMTYRQNHLLLRDSSASQEASLDFPRVLLFGQYGTLSLTINGDKNHGGYSEVEILAYDEATNQFLLQVLSFENNRPIFSKVNPPTCIACHGQHPRPLMGLNQEWRNAFASKSDRLRTEESMILDSEKYRQNYRYSQLLPVNESSIYWPYHLTDNKSHHYRPTLRYSKLISRWQAKQTANYLKQEPSFKRFEKASILALMGRSCLEKSFPSEERFESLLEFFLPKIKILYPEDYKKIVRYIDQQIRFEQEKIDLILMDIFLFGWKSQINKYFELQTFEPSGREFDFDDGESSIRHMVLANMLSNIKNTVLKNELYKLKGGACSQYEEGSRKTICLNQAGKYKAKYDLASPIIATINLEKNCSTILKSIN